MDRLILLLQIGCYILWGMLFYYKAEETRARIIGRLVMEVLLSLATIGCFLFVLTDPMADDIFPEEGFITYMILVLAGLCFFWLSKLPGVFRNRFAALIIHTSLGTFFMLALLTAVKLVPLFPFIIFPFFGVMVVAPLFATWMATSAILRSCDRYRYFSFLHTVLFGSLFLLVFQLLMNLRTDEPWSLMRQFDILYLLP